ncbi:hypothetical protein ACYJ1Y_02160 [Natrialbaceae archaeon A-gly3]
MSDRAESSMGERSEDDGEDALELAARLEVLAEENRRLREEYERARQRQYRHTAGALAALGVVAAIGALALSDAREVLLALAATGLFGGVLTYYLTPGRFVVAEVSERIYAATAANGEALVDELGLREDRIYVPVEPDAARLFVPQRADYTLPDGDGPIVVDGGARGLFLESTGSGLFREFDRARTDDLSRSPRDLAEQLADGVVTGFGLAESAGADVDPDGGRATIAITGSVLGEVDRFDHPIAAFLVVGLAIGLERPVGLEVESGDDRADWLVTCRWEPEP